MYKQYLVDESEVNKRHISELGYDYYSPYRVVERTVHSSRKDDESFTIIVSYVGKGAKAAAYEQCRRLNSER